MKIILLGAPGAGKGTQAEKIREHFKIIQISTGDLIRQEMKNNTDVGRKAQKYMDSGELVPDDIVIDMLKDRIKEDDCKNGYILDGFPRTVVQAEALDHMGINIDKVIDIRVDDQTITQRLSGRRICSRCGSSYHLQYNPTKKEGICDKCGGKLIIREDDHPDTVKERLQIYHKRTEPLIDFYQKRGLLKVINAVDGTDGIAKTTELVLKSLED